MRKITFTSVCVTATLILTSCATKLPEFTLDTAIEGMPSFTDYTATDVLNALAGVIAENTTVMAVGSSAMRMVEKGVLSVRKDEKGKKFYTKA